MSANDARHRGGAHLSEGNLLRAGEDGHALLSAAQPAKQIALKVEREPKAISESRIRYFTSRRGKGAETSRNAPARRF
jgi:hypothetical protein